MRAVLLLCLISSFALVSAMNKCNKGPHSCGGGSHSPSRFVKRPAGDFVIITTALLRLGVYGPGTLDAYPTSFPSANTDGNNPVGLRWLGGAVENDATAPGCYCEGFGVSGLWVDNTSITSDADQDTGFNGMTYGAPTPVGATGADTFALVGSGDYSINVSHEFRLSNRTANAFEVKITLTNNHPSLGLQRLRYERQMDWDIYPTTFAECVDIDLGTALDLPCAHDDGFVDGNPDTNFPGGIDVTLGSCGGSGARSAFNSGPDDHGAAFLIQFHDVTLATPLGPGQSKSFLMFYGAAGNKIDALSVLSILKAEAYSLGYPSSNGVTPSTCDNTNLGDPNTYLWGFAGLAGTVVVNTDPHCLGADCASTTACPTATSASASTTTATCASIGFDSSAC